MKSKISDKYSLPKGPFLEYWTFKISMSDAKQADSAMKIRNAVINNLKTYGASSHDMREEPHSLSELHKIYSTIQELAKDRLSEPGYDFHIVDYQEHDGSLEIEFTVQCIMGASAGVIAYGGFRQGMEYIAKDLKEVLSHISKYGKKISYRFKKRKKL